MRAAQTFQNKAIGRAVGTGGAGGARAPPLFGPKGVILICIIFIMNRL